jgi:hypothetical protein
MSVDSAWNWDEDIWIYLSLIGRESVPQRALSLPYCARSALRTCLAKNMIVRVSVSRSVSTSSIDIYAINTAFLSQCIFASIILMVEGLA